MIINDRKRPQNIKMLELINLLPYHFMLSKNVELI